MKKPIPLMALLALTLLLPPRVCSASAEAQTASGTDSVVIGSDGSATVLQDLAAAVS